MGFWRKSFHILSSVGLFLLFCGCTLFVPPYHTTDDSALWQDSEEAVSSLHIGDNSPTSTASIKSTLGEHDRIYFRSSDIEFWSIESPEDIETIFSAKYKDGSYAEGRSLEYNLGDKVESIVFSPSQNMNVDLSRPDLNPDWNSDTAAFLDAGKTTINLIRLDIGAGSVTFVINGEEVDMKKADRSDGNGINANSIIIIDNSFIDEPLLITRDVENQIVGDWIDAESLELTQEEFAAVSAIHKNNNSIDSDTPLDVNGALYIPMAPKDISALNAESNHLQISIHWPISNAVHYRNGEYFMDNRIEGTSFNFSVELSIVDNAYTGDDGDGDTSESSMPDAPVIAGISDGTFNSYQSFTITGISGALIEYTLDGGGSWSLYSGEVLLNSEGTYLVTARQTDTEGVTSDNSPTLNVTIDTTSSSVNDDPDELFSSVFKWYPGPDSTNVYTDQDIHIASWYPDVFDIENAKANFSIQPDVPHDMYTRWFIDEADTALTIELGILQPDTTYTATFDTGFTLGGNALSEPYSWQFTTGSSAAYAVSEEYNRPQFTMSEHFPNLLTYQISWTSIPDAVSYDLQETRSEIFAYVDRTLSTNENSLEVSVDYSNQYYYRVRAFDGTAYSDWSRIYYLEPIE